MPKASRIALKALHGIRETLWGGQNTMLILAGSFIVLGVVLASSALVVLLTGANTSEVGHAAFTFLNNIALISVGFAFLCMLLA
jgi:hypothetical protein